MKHHFTILITTLPHNPCSFFFSLTIYIILPSKTKSQLHSIQSLHLHFLNKRSSIEDSMVRGGPIPFKRVAAAFEVDVARLHLCESSGSEHSPDISAIDLSDLVNSFIEQENVFVYEGDDDGKGEKEENDEVKSQSAWSEMDTKEMLQTLLSSDDSNDVNKNNIRKEVEVALGLAGDSSAEGFKRLLMRNLLERGIDAGLCKTRWEKQGRTPAGEYEYIDVNIDGTRYIVEVSLAGEFETARPTASYISILNRFPHIIIAKPDELKQIVRSMCTAIRESMKSMDMHVPPWRRNGYMQAKWFSSYKRTTNKFPTKKAAKCGEAFEAKRSIGFAALPVMRGSYNCMKNVSSEGLKVGFLAAAFRSNGIGTT